MVVNSNASSQAHPVVIVCIVSPIISSLFVLLRAWTRLFVRRTFGWDDYSAVVTLLFCGVYSIILGILNASGVSNDVYYAYDKRIFISVMVYLISLFGYKITVLLLCLRLFGVNKVFRCCTWTLMGFVFLYLFGNLLTEIFGCIPVPKSYQPEILGHCIDAIKAGLVFGSMNVASDLVIFVLPLPMVWRLQLTYLEKLGVTLIFMNGAINCAVAILRYTLVVIKSMDIFSEHLALQIYIWQVIEVNTGLICSCTPAIKPFFQHFATKSFTQYSWRLSRLKPSFTRRNTTNKYNDGSFGPGFSRHQSNGTDLTANTRRPLVIDTNSIRGENTAI